MKLESEAISKICVVASAVIAFFLAILIVSELYVGRPNLAIVFGFLVAVIVCFSLGSRMAFGGETRHKILLLFSLLLGLVPIFLLSFLSAFALGVSSPAWRENNPSAVNDMFVTTVSLLALTFVVAVGAFAVLMSILRARGE